MGESTKPRATLRFDRRVRLEFRGATITSDAGLLACRELDDALGLTETANECLQESRGGRNVQHRLVGLLRQSVYSRLAGYEDTNDAERLAQDPTMRIIVGRRDIDRPAASTNTMSRFETEVLTQDGNVEGLDRLNAKWVDGAMSRTPHRRVILDMDSSESPVHGEQEGASYNGHFGSTCYHPLFVFNQFGDCEGAMLRAGNVHSAHRWRDVLDPILSRYGATGVRRYFRADAAFAKPDIYEYMEERRVFYAIRLPSNKVLQYEIAPLLIRPVGRPPKRPVIRYDDFWYRAESWDRDRRVVAKVEWHRGELFPRVGFIVTNMTAGPEGVVRFYNGRGTAEQWIKEGKYALNWTRLSCHRFVANRVRLSLFVLAYNLGNFLRRLCLPKAVKHWSLRSVQVKLIKMGGRLVDVEVVLGLVEGHCDGGAGRGAIAVQVNGHFFDADGGGDDVGLVGIVVDVEVVLDLVEGHCDGGTGGGGIAVQVDGYVFGADGGGDGVGLVPVVIDVEVVLGLVEGCGDGGGRSGAVTVQVHAQGRSRPGGPPRRQGHRSHRLGPHRRTARRRPL